MKNKIMISIATLCSMYCGVNAQSNIAFFQVEQNNYFQTSAMIPNTSLAYYNQIDGGKNIGNVVVKNENTLQKFDLQNTPAMIVNRKNTENINGDNHVYYLSDKEFAITNIILQANGSQNLITWQAEIYNSNHISFNIWKIADNNKDELIGTVQGHTIASNKAYTFTDDSKRANYKVEIVKDNNISRFTTENLKKIGCEGIANVFPTSCTDVVNITLFDKSQPANYAISNQSGIVFAKNTLVDYNTALDISNFKCGIYIINIMVNSQIQNFKIVKQ